MVTEGETWNGIDSNRTDIDRERNATAAVVTKLSPKDFAAALRSFQQANGLRATGILDAKTMQIMSQLR